MEHLVFFKVSCGVGMSETSVHLLEDTMTENELDMYAFELAVDCANAYGQYVHDDYECDDEDEDDNYNFRDSQLDYRWEVYNAEKHDMYRSGGGSFASEFVNVIW